MIKGDEMEYRQLGSSGLRVSALALGPMTFGGAGNFASVGHTDFDEASRILDRCIDAGVNFIDTADIYSDGVSEEIVGRLVKGRREDLLLATKCGFPSEPGANGAGSSRHHIVRSLDASLRRLGTDYVDLYQLHCWDGQTPLEETLATLDGLVHAGKIRYVGCSNYSAWHVMKALAVADRQGLARFVSNQIYWSVLGRDVEVEVVPAALDQGLGILVWSPLAGGLLTGKYRRDTRPTSGARHLTDWNEPPIYDQAKTFDIIDVVVEVAQAHHVPPAQVALAWLLTKPALASVIVGARQEAQIVQTLGAAELHLAPEEVTRLDSVSAPPLPYPLWHQVKVRDRLGAADRVILG
jgi:aryl-alcohol dehydrogenase-like predicted oxidoreductase